MCMLSIHVVYYGSIFPVLDHLQHASMGGTEGLRDWSSDVLGRHRVDTRWTVPTVFVRLAQFICDVVNNIRFCYWCWLVNAQSSLYQLDWFYMKRASSSFVGDHNPCFYLLSTYTWSNLPALPSPYLHYATSHQYWSGNEGSGNKP